MNNYEDLAIVKMIDNSHFFVFEVEGNADHKKYAMKIFPYHKRHVNLCYLSEARFNWLSHPNIISIVDVQPLKQNFRGLPEDISYILMELAPHGNFASLLRKDQVSKDQKLARTYFHQLIEGIEFLHKNGIAHMDLKPRNILVADRYKLKISDFDSSHPEEDAIITVSGTTNFRAPEVANRTCLNTKAADIYSAGILLFVFTTGLLPYGEEKLAKRMNIWQLMLKEDSRFWDFHTNHNIDSDMQELFVRMVKEEPSKRISINEIKSSKWYRGPVYNEQELEIVMKNNQEMQMSG
jgi:serine/threonine protein kinase